jgi:hypothetical protein
MITVMKEKINRIITAVMELNLHIRTTAFPCYKRDFVKNGRCGKWEKTGQVIEFGDKATQSMLIDGSGYCIDDPDNGLQYFVDMRHSPDE